MKRLLAAVGVIAALGWLAGVAFGATGGPDGGGYTFIDNNSPGGPAFSFNNIAGTGTVLAAASSCDDCVELNIPIGFTFNHYGTNFTTINIGSNGNAQFNTSNAAFTNSAMPTGTFGAAIAPWWDDLYPPCDTTDRILYQTVGSPGSRRFVIQWDMIPHINPPCSPPDRITFQAVLFEGTNEVLFQYLDVVLNQSPAAAAVTNGLSATVGIQRDSSVGLQYSFNTASLTDGLAICFRPPGSSPTVVCGNVIATNTPTPTATATATPLSDATRVRGNTGGAVGAIGASAADQARENRERAAAAAGPQATVVPPNTGTGITPAITPPNTGDAGLADRSGASVLPMLLLASALSGAALIRLGAKR